jgi:hypothetical protein
MVMDIIAGILGGVVAGTIIWLPNAFKLERLKAENERLNNKLQRDNPRDAHGRFTRKK